MTTQPGAHPSYPHMFTPIRLGSVEVANRFYFSPHGNQMTAGSKPSRAMTKKMRLCP